MFSLAYTIVPAGIVGGISVAKTGRYRPQLWLAWVLLLISTGLLSTLKADTPLVGSIGYSVIGGFGLGILMSVTYYPVLAPLPLSMNANAVAFFMFVRFFAQVCASDLNVGKNSVMTLVSEGLGCHGWWHGAAE